MQAETSQPPSSPTADASVSGPGFRTPWGPWTALLLTVLITAVSIAGSFALAKAGLLTMPGIRLGDSIGLEVLLAQQTLVVVLVLLVALRAPGPSATLALGPPAGGFKTYARAVALVAAFQIVVTALEYVFAPQHMLSDLKPFMELSRGPLWLFGLLVVGLGAPLSEELLFRGLLLPALAKSRIGIVGAALVSTALWTSLHASYSLVGLAEVFGTGLLFAGLLWTSGSLRVTILCHGLYNALIILGLRYLPLPAVLSG